MNSSIALPGMRRSRGPFNVHSLPAMKPQQRQAQRLAALGTLSAGIAHDFNNILAMLRGYLSAARASLGPQHPVQAELGEVENAAARAASLANRILNFSRLHDLVLGPMNIEAAVRAGLGLLRATLPARIEIVAEFAADLPAVAGDFEQIQQVLVNLGINSAQAMAEGRGVIRVSITRVHGDTDKLTRAGLREGEYVCLRFSDTGCGMDAATRERIFVPFFTTKPKDVGTGLGLSVVREIIAEHRGSITVQSKRGKGTQFSIYLPAAEAAPAEGLSTGRSPPGGKGQRILFLDDDVGFVELAERVIGKAGYRVIAHFNPAVALAEFAAAPDAFDLVVVDLAMPGASGIDIARSMMAIRADIPIILTAGYVSPDDEARAATCGVREVISKSATVQELCMAFGRVFGARG
jgi:nitrogen-specific signal transduction histidine kinase